MSSTFPLLSAIRGKLPEKQENLSEDEKMDLAKDIRKFGKEPAERVYGLIRAYSLETGGMSTISLPYEGDTMRSGPKFDLNKMPDELVFILREFVNMHKEQASN